MIRIRFWSYKPEGCTTYKIKFFKDKKYWFQENTVHTDQENADRLGRHRVTELELADHARKLGMVEISKLPLPEIAKGFITHGRRKAGRRRNPWSEKYARGVETALAWWWSATGWKVLEDINLADAEEALDDKVDERNGEPILGKTKNNLMSNLRAMLKHARKPVWKDGARLAPKDWDPLENWEEYNDDPQKVFREFELPEFQAMLAYSESQEERIAYCIAAVTGARFSALQALQILDADWVNSRIRVKRMTAKNRKETWKAVPRYLMDELEFQARGRAPEEPLLLGLVGHQGAKTVQRRLRAAGIPVETAKGVLAFHSLKVTFVNVLLDGGTDIRTAQGMADHSVADLTARVYARQREAAHRQAAERVVGEWVRAALPAPGPAPIHDGVIISQGSEETPMDKGQKWLGRQDSNLR